MINSLSQLLQIMQSHGATRFYAKKLAPNDNSKNQVYLGGDFSALNIIPYKGIYTDGNDIAGSKRDRAKADVTFYWLDAAGKYVAPDVQLILYPKYPEVRMSGFLKGCDKAPSEIMRVRDEGRVLFLGITGDGSVLGYAATADEPVAKELHSRNDWETTGVFIEIPPNVDAQLDTRQQLLSALRRVYQKHWIPSQKMRSDGIIEPYSARNGGGYTLEAELGISPNGYAEPDYMGWEVKQYGVADFTKFRPKGVVTLMTPEPSGGYYQDAGVADFLRRYSYPDKSGKPDRFNFGGIYACNRDFHGETGLRLMLEGFDEATGRITDMEGGIVLLSRNDEIAALWSFTGIMQHWNRKHAQAAYVPSIFQTPPPEYAYGPRVLLCERTDFTLFLKAIASGVIYYDPAIKVEGSSSAKPKIKRRSQFRIKHDQLTTMYHQYEVVDLESAG